ncbi:MAG: Sua5 family C-terminal domain-containing protein [Melioribacteraceae bacterium]|nr:Sua5 family C-terminal domain-containing protein [Melioribacteraceae bacterium]
MKLSSYPKKVDFQEAAANLFSSLHILDEKMLDLIVIEKIPERDLGLAIMDRLKKAVANFD